MMVWVSRSHDVLMKVGKVQFRLKRMAAAKQSNERDIQGVFVVVVSDNERACAWWRLGPARLEKPLCFTCQDSMLEVDDCVWPLPMIILMDFEMTLENARIWDIHIWRCCSLSPVVQFVRFVSRILDHQSCVRACSLGFFENVFETILFERLGKIIDGFPLQ